MLVHELHPVLGFWTKPTANLRFNFDYENTNNDNAMVRIGLRKESRYRIQGNYTPRPWAILGSWVNRW